MSLGWLVVIACISMVVKDFVMTFLVIAEARGRAHLSGLLNAAGTPASVVFYSFGSVGMVHGHGLIGWLSLLPVMVVDYIDGRVFTALGRRIQPEGPSSHEEDCSS